MRLLGIVERCGSIMLFAWRIRDTHLILTIFFFIRVGTA